MPRLRVTKRVKKRVKKMKSNCLFVIFIPIILGFLASCSHRPARSGISIEASTAGLIKNRLAPFPIYLTEAIVDRKELEKKYSSDVYVIHIGHILKPNLTKAENEKNLETLATLGMNLVNLTLEDFVIAEAQGIQFDKYNQQFLNSSVVDLTLDTLATAKNINAYQPLGKIAFIGLSDRNLNNNLSQDNAKAKYIVADYVLSILKVKKTALKNSSTGPFSSFIIIQTIGAEINEVMARLPPTFTNSLAD